MFKKTMLVATLFAVSISTAAAMNFDEADVGDTVYIDTFFNDEQVTVVEKDSSDNTIKIKRSSGETLWKKPDKLMTSWGKDFEDAVEDEVIDWLGDVIKKSLSDNNN